MKKLLPIFIVLFAFHGFAQEITGRAFYTSIITLDEPDLEAEEMDAELMQAIAEANKKGFHDEYELQFTQEESTFKKLPKLEKPDPKNGFSASVSIIGNDKILYKNLKENKVIKETDIYGKEFLIQDNLEIPNWQLSKENKTIGEYVCFKARYLRPRLRSDAEDTSQLSSGKEKDNDSLIKSEKEDKEIIA